MGDDNPHGHDGLDRLFDGQTGRGASFLWGERAETPGRDKGGGDKNGHLRLAIEIRHLIRHESQHIISFLRKFNKDGLAEGAFSCGREGIGQLFGGGIDVFDNRDRREETVPPANQFAAQDVGGNKPMR